MSSSNCSFLTCIQVSQEAGQVVWYCHLFQNFPQFTVIHTVKGVGRVNKAEIDVYKYAIHKKANMSILCFIDNAKAFDCVDHNKLWKILKEMGNQTTWSASWEICMQVRKQQLELDMEQQTGSK